MNHMNDLTIEFVNRYSPVSKLNKKKPMYLRLRANLIKKIGNEQVLVGYIVAYIFNKLFTDKDFLDIAETLNDRVFDSLEAAWNELYEYESLTNILVIDSLEIDAAHRKNGYAHILLSELQEYAFKTMNVQAILLHSIPHDVKVIPKRVLLSFFLKHGFKAYEKYHLINLFRDYNDKLQMRHLTNTIKSVDTDLLPLLDNTTGAEVMTPNSIFENRIGQLFYASYIDEGCLITTEEWIENYDEAILLTINEVPMILEEISMIEQAAYMTYTLDKRKFQNEELYWLTSVLLTYLKKQKCLKIT